MQVNLNKNKLMTALLVLALVPSSVFAKVNSLSNNSSAAKSLIATSGNFDGNRVKDDLENNGMIVSHRITGHSGMEWPKDNHTYSIFASGIWYAGKVGDDLRCATAEYGPEMVPGPYGTNSADPNSKIWKVNKADLADPLASYDFQNWPVADGAPWVDVDGDGVYSPLPLGTDHPEFIGDQVIWFVRNDGDAVAHTIFQTLPLGIEVQTTIFGFDRPDDFGDMMFVKELIINKGDNTINDMFVGLWSDPDLGDAGDDFVGCDTTLGLGFCWNDGVDADYSSYAGGTPAVGYDFFQGPIVPSAADTAFSFGRDIPGYKNLPMTSFSKYINGDPVYTDPNDVQEVYYYMQGKMRDGSDFPEEATGGSNFIHPGNPSDNVDAFDDVLVDPDLHASGDRRFLMNAGPFNMAYMDSQEVVFAIMHAAAGDAKASVDLLKVVDQLAQTAYDIQFALPASPPSPVVTHNVQADEINLYWNDASESYLVESQVDLVLDVESLTPVTEEKAVATITSSTAYAWLDTDNQQFVAIESYSDTVDYGGPVVVTGMTYDTTYSMTTVTTYDTVFASEPTIFDFEGYNVYQYETLSGTGASKKIATYDKINDVTTIYDNVFDANLGESVLITVQGGTDSGIRNHITIKTDALNSGSPLIPHRAYYFAVTAYAYNEYGIPNNLESAPKIIEIRPSDPVEMDVASDGDDEFSEDEVTHGAGQSDGSVDVVVVNPLEVTGDDYEVHFRSQDYYKDGTGTWQIGTPPGAMAAKVVDISGSSCTATGYVGAGQIKLQFDFTLDGGAGYAWCDGFKLTLPDELSIISAGSVDAISARCDAAPTISGQTILWGIEGPPTAWGCIEGNTTFEVLVADFDPSVSPVSIDWIAYDDDYGQYYDVAIVHAEGTIEISSLVYETANITVWDVKNVTKSTTAASDQTILGGTDQLTGTSYGGLTDKGWTHFDGIKVKVSGAPPHSTKSYSWDESAGTVSPLYASVETFTDGDGDGVYDFAESYSDFGVDGQEDVLEPGFNDVANLDPNGDDYSATNLLGSEGNGAYNSYPTPEPFTDGDADGVWDFGEAYEDVGTDGIASSSEQGYIALNLDPVGDNYEAASCDSVGTTQAECESAGGTWNAGNPTGTEGNLTYDVGEVFTDANGDGSWTGAEAYDDANGNNSYDAGYAADAVWFNESSINTFHAWWGGASTIGGTDYPEVELRFVEMQTFEDSNGDGLYSAKEPYTWDTSDPNSGNADMYRTWGAEWTGFNPVPYSAWNMDTDPATQLSIVQRDLDNNGQWDGARGGNYNYIWITNVPYDGTSKFDDGDDENDFMHHLITTGEGVPAYYTADLDIPGSANQMARSGVLTITPKRDNLPNADVFSFSTAGAVASTYDPDKINVWPNPYFGYNPEERDPLDQQLHFTNLPTSGECTIRIFDLAGQPVKSLYHTNETPYEVWDLTNNYGLPVASGMYITHIKTDGGEKILKLGIVQPEQRIDVY